MNYSQQWSIALCAVTIYRPETQKKQIEININEFLSFVYRITFVFHFSLVRLQPSQEKLKTRLMQNFGGQIRSIMGNVEVACAKLVTLTSFARYAIPKVVELKTHAEKVQM